MKAVLLAIILSFTALAHTHSSDSYFKSWTMMTGVKVRNMHKSLQKFSKMGIEIAGVSYPDKIIDLLVNDIQYHQLEEMGYRLDIVNTKGVSAAPDEEYKNPQEIEEIVHNFANSFPKISRVISIGKSLEGRDIWAMKITQSPDKEDPKKPSVLFNSMHHAREIMSPEVSLDIIEYLLTNYSKDKKVKDWLKKTTIWVVPMLNVDGNNKMWTVDKMWRKNTRGGFGVDINRNYPGTWNACGGSSGLRISPQYRGPSAASEPETQVMMNLVKMTRPVFDISYHSFSELVLYPYGCKGKDPDNLEVMAKIGDHMGWLLDYKSGQTWDAIYEADGGDIDWMYDQYNVIPFVIELNSRWDGGFHPRYSRHRDKTVIKNRLAWQYLLERVHQSGVRGIVTKAGSPLSEFKMKVYKVKLGGIKRFFQNYLGHESGVYHLVLNPGKYLFEIYENGVLVGSKKTNVKDSLKYLDIKL